MVNGIKGAIDFLRAQLGVETLKNMPYPTMLIPLSVFFAVPGQKQIVVSDAQRRTLVRWFWRSCFVERYSGQTNRVAKTDIDEMVNLRKDRACDLGTFTTQVDPEFFLRNVFRLSTARTATFVLLLATASPRSFISGGPVKLSEVLQAYNRHEFHHMYPQAALRDDGVDPDAISSLANMCFLSRADNNKIRRSRPSEYRDMMPDGQALDQILSAAFTSDVLFSDDYEAFRADRAGRLAEAATRLTA